MTNADVAERAELLRVLLALSGEEPTMTPTERQRLGLSLDSLDAADRALMEDGCTPDDFALATDLLNGAHVLRRSQWRALEELLALLPGGAAPLPTQLLRLRDVHEGRFHEACRRVAYLDWIHPPNEGDDS